MPASPLRNSNIIKHPSNSPLKSQQSPQPSMQIPQPHSPPILAQQILMATFQRNDSLCPVEPKKNPVGSRRIDAIAHGMWDVVFSKADIMDNVTMKTALFTALKLRALSKLNWLPSWWFLREMALGVMERLGWLVDDSEREKEWKEAVSWCAKAEKKLFGDSAATQNQGDSPPNPGVMQ